MPCNGQPNPNTGRSYRNLKKEKRRIAEMYKQMQGMDATTCPSPRPITTATPTPTPQNLVNVPVETKISTPFVSSSSDENLSPLKKLKSLPLNELSIDMYYPNKKNININSSIMQKQVNTIRNQRQGVNQNVNVDTKPQAGWIYVVNGTHTERGYTDNNDLRHYYKIGRTEDMDKRLSEYRVGNRRNQLKRKWYVSDMFQAEHELIKQLPKYATRVDKETREWFTNITYTNMLKKVEHIIQPWIIVPPH